MQKLNRNLLKESIKIKDVLLSLPIHFGDRFNWKIQWGLACPDHEIGKEAWEEKCRKEGIVSDRC